MTVKFLKLLRLWNTVRFLKPAQVYRRAIKKFTLQKFVAGAALERRSLDHSKWKKPACRKSSMVGPLSFHLLNENVCIEEAGWSKKDRPLLLRYNLHYFDDLNAEYAPERVLWHIELIESWLMENDVPIDGKPGLGWEPYPLSLRIVNWVKWHLAGNILSTSAEHSMANQARWLMQTIEWHLLGNHLFVNAKALIFAGTYFEGREADLWLRTGWNILKREIPEQILPDGGQFELSPMYHALALEDMLDLFNISKLLQSEHLIPYRKVVEHMLTWHLALCHDDGEISHFNDSAFGIAPKTSELLAYAQRIGVSPQGCKTRGIFHLADSGYIRLTHGYMTALLDVAKVGPDYLPAHAHADSLSFELSVNGKRMLVNSGTSEYGVNEERLRQRSTLAHNCVVVDQTNSSDVWSSFRVGKRANPFNLSMQAKQTSSQIACSHDGYSTKKIEHRRIWDCRENALYVSDRVFGLHKLAIAYFYFAPECKITLQTPHRALVIHPELKGVCLVELDGAKAEVISSTYHPEFGKTVPNLCIALQLKDGQGSFRITYVPEASKTLSRD